MTHGDNKGRIFTQADINCNILLVNSALIMNFIQPLKKFSLDKRKLEQEFLVVKMEKSVSVMVIISMNSNSNNDSSVSSNNK